jgi:hypothetical protein
MPKVMVPEDLSPWQNIWPGHLQPGLTGSWEMGLLFFQILETQQKQQFGFHLVLR